MTARDETMSAGAEHGDAHAPGGERPGMLRRHRRAALTVLGGVAVVGFVYYVVPQIAGLGPTLRRLRGGDVSWLVIGMLLEVGSIGGEIGLFRGVFSRPGNGIGWRASSEITLAGGAATKVLATAGAGGIALTVWALRGYGLASAEVATGMVCYEILNYGVYMAALVIGGFGLWVGAFDGPAPIGMTLLPALFGATVIVIVVSTLFTDGPAERFLLGRADASHSRSKRWWRRAASLASSLRSGLLAALHMLRRRDRSLAWPFAAWGFDIGALWASFHAFGHSPPAAVLVMAYYVGTLANTLPLPGGIGGVEGGMIGSFLAFGVNGSLAVLAVLAYRTVSYWLPTLPGAIAYFRLRRRANAWHDPPEGKADAAAEPAPGLAAAPNHPR